MKDAKEIVKEKYGQIADQNLSVRRFIMLRTIMLRYRS